MTACELSHLFKVPLTAVIDFKGYRLIAMTQLPISSSTLVYGSADGGASFACQSPAMYVFLFFNWHKHRACFRLKNTFSSEEKMATLGSSLNLKGHNVRLGDGKSRFT